jgi:orotate phosphoribosyltransferase
LSDFLEKVIAHLRQRSLRTDGPFVLASGRESSWYLDARQTTLDGFGAALVGSAFLDALDSRTTAVGGMTLGADPIAVATAVAAASQGRSLVAFSIRRQAKDHGTGGRVVGPVTASDRITVVEDTTTTGAALGEAIEVLIQHGMEVLEAIALVDRSGGDVERRLHDLGIPYRGLITPADLGVEP